MRRDSTMTRSSSSAFQPRLGLRQDDELGFARAALPGGSPPAAPRPTMREVAPLLLVGHEEVVERLLRLPCAPKRNTRYASGSGRQPRTSISAALPFRRGARSWSVAAHGRAGERGSIAGGSGRSDPLALPPVGLIRLFPSPRRIPKADRPGGARPAGVADSPHRAARLYALCVPSRSPWPSRRQQNPAAASRTSRRSRMMPMR